MYVFFQLLRITEHDVDRRARRLQAFTPLTFADLDANE